MFCASPFSVSFLTASLICATKAGNASAIINVSLGYGSRATTYPDSSADESDDDAIPAIRIGNKRSSHEVVIVVIAVTGVVVVVEVVGVETCLVAKSFGQLAEISCSKMAQLQQVPHLHGYSSS
ncbi:hypothetical protein L1987_18906 [Smallanthus sonchifolius]|uniref:Uncharacterized protein n=1 Tax=Smallanthus sonchifolius TaxID=185202 RepID=A0ACB9J1U9_9ASTR|nr:hypothetical protein L1987_18906 [Smallanthus sonchifolius]